MGARNRALIWFGDVWENCFVSDNQTDCDLFHQRERFVAVVNSMWERVWEPEIVLIKRRPATTEDKRNVQNR